MPEAMTNQDAIEYLLYMKHNVLANSPVDIALDTAISALKNPTIEAEPVRHGQWKYDFQNAIFVCSKCLMMYRDNPNYCPRCGAKMDGEVQTDARTN